MFSRPAGEKGSSLGPFCIAGFRLVAVMSGTYWWSQTPLKSGRPFGSLGGGPVGRVQSDFAEMPVPLVVAWAAGVAIPGIRTAASVTRTKITRRRAGIQTSPRGGAQLHWQL